MLNLFKIEWLKIKTYRTFWLLYLAFMTLFPIGFFFVAKKFMDSQALNMQENLLKAIMNGPFVFPKVWHSASWTGGLFFLVIGMLFILLVTNEVQYRTHRQNIIDGWSRMDFLKAKFSLILFFVVTSTAVVFLTGLIVGLAFTPSGANIMEGMYFVAYFALMATAYLMVAFLIAVLIKRTGLAIIIYFVAVVIVDNILWVISTFKGLQIGFFVPMETVDSLIPNPSGLMRTRTVSDLTLILAAVGYLVLYTIIIVRYFKNTDLKT